MFVVHAFIYFLRFSNLWNVDFACTTVSLKRDHKYI